MFHRWVVRTLCTLCLFVDWICSMWFYLEMVLHEPNHKNLSLPTMYAESAHSIWAARDDGPNGSSGFCPHCCIMVVKSVKKTKVFLFCLSILICALSCMTLSRMLITCSIIHRVRTKRRSCHSEYHAHVLYTLTCRQSWYAGRSNSSSPPGLRWRVPCGVMHGNYMDQYASSNIALYLLSNSGCLLCRAADMDTCVRVCVCV